MIKKYSPRGFEDLPLEDHLQALESSAIGNGISSFLKEKRIKLVMNEKLPKDVYGQFAREPFSQGRIEYRERTNALIIGHEGRHAWQSYALDCDMEVPGSPQDFVLVRRFIEADARAVHFATTLEMIDAMGIDHDYSKLLLKTLHLYERKIYGDDKYEIGTVCGNRQKFLKATRRAFDAWMIYGLGDYYDEQIKETLARAGTSSIKRFFAKTAGLSIFHPNFTKAAPDPDFPRRLGEVLGRLPGASDNYLLDTDGPALDDPYYTRICNYRVEDQVDRMLRCLG